MSIEKLFEGVELSDEVKTGIVEAFNASVDGAVAARLSEKTAELETEYSNKIDEKISELEVRNEKYINEELLPNVDRYLTAAVNEWSDENKVALVSEAKVQMAESFISGLVGLVESQSLRLPEDKIDLIESLKRDNASLTAKINEGIEERVVLSEQINELRKERLFNQVTAGLTDVQRDKISESAMGIEFKTVEQYTTACKTLVESYFPENGEVVPKPAQINESKVPSVGITKEQSYVEALMAKVRS